MSEVSAVREQTCGLGEGYCWRERGWKMVEGSTAWVEWNERASERTGRVETGGGAPVELAQIASAD